MERKVFPVKSADIILHKRDKTSIAISITAYILCFIQSYASMHKYKEGASVNYISGPFEYEILIIGLIVFLIFPLSWGLTRKLKNRLKLILLTVTFACFYINNRIFISRESA